MYADVDREGRRVAVLADRGGGNAPPDLPYKPGSVYALDGATGQVVGGHTFEPLRPHFKDVQFWQSVSVSARGDAAAVGLYDGRTFVFDLDPVRPKFTHDFGAPLVVSGVPVSAISTYTHFGPDGSIYFQTGDSSVPFAAMSQHVVSPPGPHPNANTIHVVSAEGKVAWRYRSGHKYQGFWTSADGRWMMTCVRRETADGALDAGAMLFDTHRPGGGTSKLAYYYQVEGLSFFHADMAHDGSAIAIIEIPYRRPDTGQIVGAYQVHVVR
jgi:outer membrane protein assembly factor BamB